MAAIKHLISRSRITQLLRSHTSYRSLCSQIDSPPPPNPNPNPDESQPQEPSRFPQPVVPQSVSYPVKPKPKPEPTDPQNPQFRSSEGQNGGEDAGMWSREDFRYVKDMTPTVSYPTRVAPLPEDRKYESNESEESMEMRKRESEERVRKRVFRIYEEEKLPFPTLIKQEGEKKTKEKVVYDLKEAIHLLKANTKCNFDETLEAHVKMTPDLRRTDLKLIGTASLPHGTGKPVRIAVFAEGGAADEARAAGADVVGGEDLIEGIKNGSIKVDFDKCISTPQLMSRVSKEISKILRRSTPNAKDGTVTTDLSRVVREAKQNVNFRKDKSAIVHVGLGKVSFSEDALRENVGAFVNALLLAKPAGLKKSSKFAGYVGTFHLCSTMGRSYPISIQSLSIAADRYNKTQMSFANRLTNIKENHKFQKDGKEGYRVEDPAKGLRHIVSYIKEQHAVKYDSDQSNKILNCYWRGVKPGVAEMEHYESELAFPISSPGVESNEPCGALTCMTKNGLGLVNPDRV